MPIRRKKHHRRPGICAVSGGAFHQNIHNKQEENLDRYPLLHQNPRPEIISHPYHGFTLPHQVLCQYRNDVALSVLSNSPLYIRLILLWTYSAECRFYTNRVQLGANFEPAYEPGAERVHFLNPLRTISINSNGQSNPLDFMCPKRSSLNTRKCAEICLF